MPETLQFAPIKENEEIVAPSVFKAALDISGIRVAEIDPQYMGGRELTEHYGVDPADGANCIIVRGKHGETHITAALLVPVGYRADINGVVRKKLNAKKVSFAPLEEVLRETGMEYGSITPIGLPSTYQILIDSRVMEKEILIVGGGKQLSKLLIPTKVLKELPHVEVVKGLAYPVSTA